MPIKDFGLDGIGTRSDLATALCVAVPALDSVSLVSLVCQRSECSLAAAKHNNGYCVLHLQSWFPSELNKFGQPSVKRRGYGLYGPQFLLGYRNSNPTTCACSSPLCEKLGYSHHGMFRFPKDSTDSVKAARILGMSA